MSISVIGANKRYGDFAALDDVSIEIADGQLTSLLGPSGSGKSTLLRAIAGLDTLDSGTVVINGNDVSGKAPQKRDIGFVFQHYAAFKHLTVRDNIAFGLKIRKRPKAEVDAKVDELLEVVGLTVFQKRFPSQLSGGQRQRMALARALAVDPKVLLLDEPFGALDAKVRDDLRRWLRRLHDELHVTSVFVTHDQDEAVEVSDRIVLINQGQVEQVGAPDEVYRNPASSFVYSFLGSANRFPLAGSDSAVGYARPHETTIVTDLGLAGNAGVAARVSRIHAFGSSARVELQAQHLTDSKAAPQYYEVELTRQEFEALQLTEGRPVHLVPAKLRSFDLAKAA